MTGRVSGNLIGIMISLPVLLCTPGLPWAGSSLDSLDKTRKELEVVEERRKAADENIQRSVKRESGILESLEVLDREIGLITTRIRRVRSEETGLVTRIDETENNLNSIRSEREAAGMRLSLRSTALYKAGNVSYLGVIAGSSGIEDLERRIFYLRRIAEHDSRIFNRAANLYRREQQQIEALRSSRSRLSAARKDLEDDFTALTRSRRSKDLLLASVRDEKEKNSRLLAELETSSRRLRSLLEALKQEAESGDSAFAMLKGSLDRPVSGKIIVDFGRNRSSHFNTYTLSRGITIKSAEGTPVRAVYRGKVIFADWFRGYGRIIIIDHGGGYYTLYGHLSEIQAELGREVETSEIIGQAGDSGSLEGPALYFEIRHHGKPVDPKPWFLSRAKPG